MLFARKDAAGQERDRFEQLGVIEKVETSESAAPIVIVPKSDRIVW